MQSRDSSKLNQMDQIVVKIGDKFINEAFQKWCFENGILWVGEVGLLNVSTSIQVIYDIDVRKHVLIHPNRNELYNFTLPSQWNEATAAILEMIKPKEKKWTDEDMVSFAMKLNDMPSIIGATANQRGIYSYSLNDAKVIYYYVHQFQNLFFALTGTELEIK